jgi:hypothetical protein
MTAEGLQIPARHCPGETAAVLLGFHWHWRALDLLWNFESENRIRARPALIAVLLQELSSNNPVPRALAE